ncbi:hypothetical protein [Vibrio sp. 2-2(8)]|uniref:hypothetical protein n=1 Tax=Vibrio sp. 2-2(8) TaxID=2591014 RepID=UPI001481E16A|nr:hypothetical protein [Vibrio sp. 2-2(8)]NNN48685.1 hypothetical protein [Vibrio sp. 2-2(8)]
MKKEDLKAYGQARGIWRKSSLNGRSEQVKVAALPATSQAPQSQSYVSEQVLASQAAQSQSVSYPSGVSIADYYGITKAQVSERLAESIGLQCSLEEEMAKNHQHVLITDLEDAHKVLHNLWLESGRDVAALAASINTAKSWFNHTDPMFNARSIAKQFGDMGIKADLVESKGKTFVAFSGTDKNGKALKHAFVNGTRINMNGKKYPLNSFKSVQAGFSPKSRAANFKGAGVLTFVVSASIATSDLVFKDDYHLVDWFGHVGSDMFKALVQFGAGEAALFAAAFYGVSIMSGAILVVFAYIAIEAVWSEYKIADKVVGGLESALE